MTTSHVSRVTRFRPCIDLHDGRVKQIVGGSLRDDQGAGVATENFVSDKPPAYFANLYREAALTGGHVIKLGPGNDDAAMEALRTWPGGLQVGGGITVDNAQTWLDAGASHVIVTSYVFDGGSIKWERLRLLVEAVGRDRIVLDLSCKRKPPESGDDAYYVVTDRWQKYTDFALDERSVSLLAASCAEFLVHGVDVEGLRQGIQEDLVAKLAEWSPIPVTYAGGARGLQDLELIKTLGGGRVDLTIGSALDIFGANYLLTT